MTSAAQLAEPAVFDETLQAALARLVPIDVRHYVGCMMQLGRLKEAAIHIEANRQAFAGSENIFGPDEIVEAANFLEEQGVDDASLSLRVHFASKTLMTLSGRGVYNCIIEPTAAGVIFGFPSPADDESRANYDIAITEALIDNFDDPLFEAVSFVVYPLELYQTFVKLSREQGEPAFGFV
ncbi:hypothetical protein DVT68_07345 [Dyella solisilvae]|uniref:Uncharacterized protein n=2 Tax=Dyella solisilvae TaxID=1920168 RepID=A0A370K6T7_9GAMM|nr:hypothetical protein DVT68_07345 [Dyella solisilvae]